MKIFILIVLGIIILFGCSLGDYAEGCCGMPGASDTPEKDMNIAVFITLPSLILFFIILCNM